MRSFLIRCFPARWRARYGDEFEAVLEERPLGPFDVADILLGALDAHLRLRGHGVDTDQARRFTMSLRVGGIAAIVGAPLWTAAYLIANGTFGNVNLAAAAALLIAGSLAMLVALVGLSAFQARVEPVLSWVAFALPALGTIALIGGAFGAAFGGGDLGDVFFLGLLTFFGGSVYFAIATIRTAVLSRRAAVLLAVAPVVTFAGGNGDGFGTVLILSGLICFTLAWVALGVLAVRLDRPTSEPRPA